LSGTEPKSRKPWKVLTKCAISGSDSKMATNPYPSRDGFCN
jgi:hypothetical protein